MDTHAPRLLKKSEFETAIQNNVPSVHAQKVLKESKLVVLLGVAGGGRNTLINYLVATGPYYFIVSDTTRPPKVRDGKLEEHGKQYFFRNEEEFLNDIKNGEFIEAEVIHGQQVSGTSIRELERATQLGLIGIHDFDIIGAANIQKLKPDAHIIGLLPPSFNEWQSRLKAREDMHSQEFYNRMKTAVLILEDMIAKPYFKFIISDDVHHSSTRLRDLVEKNTYSSVQRSEGIEIATEMLQRTKELLVSLSN